MTAVVFLGFNLLNARRGVKPTLATLGARLVVVIRSCWIFATVPCRWLFYSVVDMHRAGASNSKDEVIQISVKIGHATVVENKHHILQKRRSQSLTCSKNVKPVPQNFTSTKSLK